MDMDKGEYDPKYGNVQWKYVENFKAGKLQGLGAKDCAYMVRTPGGKLMVGPAKLAFLESKYKEPHKIKTYDFGKYSDGVTTATEDDTSSKAHKKFNPRNVDFKDKTMK